jgi:hypothetical protein
LVWKRADQERTRSRCSAVTTATTSDAHGVIKIPGSERGGRKKKGEDNHEERKNGTGKTLFFEAMWIHKTSVVKNYTPRLNDVKNAPQNGVNIDRKAQISDVDCYFIFNNPS